MHSPFLFLLLLIFFHSPLAAASSPNVLAQGLSLSVENNDHLVSTNGLFTAGFHPVGQNAYCLAIWFSEPMLDGNLTLVWMANRDEPVNGKRSMFSLWENGNLVLTDAGRSIWSTNTESNSSLELQLLDSGNLVLCHSDEQPYLWQSFNFPTDTILPNQPFTKDTVLISSRSSKNLSSGFYKLYFDIDNVIRLRYNRAEITSIYWPSPWLKPWLIGRSAYNYSRFALINSNGRFMSSDDLEFFTTDYGQTLQRRLTLDVDGNVRVYTLNNRSWAVSWQAFSKPCEIHGICGPNSVCTNNFETGRRCSCMHGYRTKNHTDWSYGCEPMFDLNGNREDYEFIKYPHLQFYGFDSLFLQKSTLKACKEACLDDSNCKAIEFSYVEGMGYFNCYVKTHLFNGHHLDSNFSTYVRLPKISVLSFYQKIANDSSLDCSSSLIKLKRTYETKHANGSLKFMLWFSVILGIIEFMCMVFFFYGTLKPSATTQTYLAVASRFRRFTYAEIRTASRNFAEEIGRGGGGIVYKGMLPDTRVVAIKQLHEASQGEAQFLAEMNAIGRINHMNLIETYGYCAEGKHRILVYEYMENGSLARSLRASQPDWQKRFEIATGIAKGLAYLHEECLEWVLHCDVKPQNILLDASYNPKVADFGLSKLFNRGVTKNSIFSRIRGTRGYMAPEWVFNLPITSKVDVYSYGMVVLEMITGRSPTCDIASDDDGGVEQKRLVSWVREKIHEPSQSLTETRIEEIVDPTLSCEYDKVVMKNLVKVALQCVEEDKDARPTMSDVVKMLLHPEIDN